MCRYFVAAVEVLISPRYDDSTVRRSRAIWGRFAKCASDNYTQAAEALFPIRYNGFCQFACCMIG